MLKVFILLSFLLTANSYSLRSEASEIAVMKKMISLMQSQINLLRNKEGISKVAEIRYSTLTEKKKVRKNKRPFLFTK
tara:strand:+ start:468 stop:701 length:234 start_codon:yes stop_codon:yes gene_type:complete